jgi:DinB superfamily
VTSIVRLRAQLEQIRALIDTPDLLDADAGISRWSPAEHLDHLIKVSSAIVGRVREENPPAEPRGISFLGQLILTCGWIPRGRGRSPARLHGARASPVELEAALTKLEKSVAAVMPEMLTPRTPTVPHPLFGGLTPSQGMRFVVIHNAHHLKIVRDILRKKA